MKTKRAFSIAAALETWFAACPLAAVCAAAVPLTTATRKALGLL